MPYIKYALWCLIAGDLELVPNCFALQYRCHTFECSCSNAQEGLTLSAASAMYRKASPWVQLQQCTGRPHLECSLSNAQEGLTLSAASAMHRKASPWVQLQQSTGRPHFECSLSKAQEGLTLSAASAMYRNASPWVQLQQCTGMPATHWRAAPNGTRCAQMFPAWMSRYLVSNSNEHHTHTHTQTYTHRAICQS